MHRSRKFAAAGAAATAALALGTTTLSALSADAGATAPATAPGQAQRLIAYGLGSDGLTLSRVDLTNARPPAVIGAVSGFNAEVGDTSLVGIDVRPQNGLLYGVGDKGGVYTVATDGALTYVNRLVVNGVPTVPTGSAFGVDFNPAANRLRIISDTGLSLRHNVEPGGVTLKDTDLNLGGNPFPGVQAVAYTNNDADGVGTGFTGTALYDLSGGTDTLYLQNPPNEGKLVAVGSLGIDVSAITSFDIYSVRDAAGKAVSNEGYFVATAPKDSDLPRLAVYTIDLTTGAATLLRPLQSSVTSIAVPLG